MISNSVDFLISRYTHVSILINRYCIVGSVSDLESEDFKSDLAYLNSIINYGENKVLAVNLDSYFSELFMTDKSCGVRLAVVIDLKSFKKEGRQRIEQLMDKHKLVCSREFIACFVTNRSEITKVEISSLNLFPKIIRALFKKNGILSCRFSDDNIPEYHIDPESLLLKLWSDS